MPGSPLPPGWVGNEDRHRLRLGHLGIDVFDSGDGSYLWTIWTARGLRVVREGGDDENLTAPEARHAALTALRTLGAALVSGAERAIADLNTAKDRP